VPDPLEFTYQALPGRVVFGAGAARQQLAAEVDRLGGRRVLLVTGPREAGRAAELAAPLQDRVVATFSAVVEHVPIEVARAARSAAADGTADLLLAIGGGSTIGTAKAVAMTSGLPILAVPTTYAGSELTPVWGLTENGRKTTGIDPVVQPRTVVYDAELTLTLPAPMAVASGMNAMAHSVEAFWAPGRNPVTALSASESITALAAGLRALHADPDSVEARAQVLYGAYLAGAAFAVAGSGLHHKICHVLGGAYRLPHAQTHSVVLPYVVAVNAPAAPDAAARISAALASGQADGRAGGVAVGVAAGVAGAAPPTGDPARELFALNRALGNVRSLEQLGLLESDLDQAAGLVLDVVPKDNPVPLTLTDVRALLQAAWAGTDPADPADPVQTTQRIR